MTIYSHWSLLPLWPLILRFLSPFITRRWPLKFHFAFSFLDIFSHLAITSFPTLLLREWFIAPCDPWGYRLPCSLNMSSKGRVDSTFIQMDRWTEKQITPQLIFRPDSPKLYLPIFLFLLPSGEVMPNSYWTFFQPPTYLPVYLTQNLAVIFHFSFSHSSHI